MLSPYPDAALLRRSDVGLVGRHPHRNYRRADKSGKMHKWAEDRQRQFALGGRARRYSPAVQSPRNNGMSEVDALDALPQGHL